MESGRFLLAVVLMIAVVVITNILIPPVAPEPAAPGADSATVEAPGPAGPESAEVQPGRPAAVLEAVQPAAPADPDTILPVDTVSVTTDLYRLGLSSRGGALVSATLLEYRSFAPGHETEPVRLAPESGPGLVRHRLRLGDLVVDLADLAFEAKPSGDIEIASDGGPRQLELVFRDSATSIGISFRYTFRPGDYVIDVDGRVTGVGTTPQLLLDVGPTLAFNEATPQEDERSLAYAFNSRQEGIQNVSLNRFREERVDNGPLTWVALKNKYFLLAVMQDDEQAMPFGGLIARPTGESYSADLSATLLGNAQGEFAYRIYIGPQDFDRMAALDNQLQDVSVFGWKFLQPVLRPLGHAITWALLQLHRALGLGYGWVLILFGFLIRFVLWPLNSKAMRSQMKNMEMQPRIKEIQARYKSDPQKLQQEMLRLYKEEGFNPMGGCLPMLLPLPVLITLFFVFQSTIEFRGVPFLWLPDLARHDPLFILPVALGLSMFVQQWLNMRVTKDAPKQMKYMTYIMPVFLTFLFLRFASGLNLYYASMNVASVPQQLQIMREKKRRMMQ